MIPKASDLAILSKAYTLEREYHWSEAVHSYEVALISAHQASLDQMGDIHEHLGYAQLRSAMQAENSRKFKHRMREASQSYRKARNVYANQTCKDNVARVLRCDAMVSYIRYWLASTASRKRKLIDECWRLTKMSLKAFVNAKEDWEFGKTFNQLSLSAFLAFFLEWNFQARKTMIKEALDYGERAIGIFSKSQDSHELVLAQVKTAIYLEMFGLYFQDLDERESWMQKASSYRRRAKDHSEEIAVIETLNSGAPTILSVLDFMSEWDKEVITDFDKALNYVKKTRDRFTTGWIFAWLAFNECLKREEVNPAEGIEADQRGLKYAEEAQRNFSVISYVCPLSCAYWPESPQADYYYGRFQYETNREKAMELADEGLEAVANQLNLAKSSGYPEAMCNAQLMLGAILRYRALIESHPEKKRGFLEEALPHLNECARIFKEFLPFCFMLHIFTQKELAGIERELSKLSKDAKTRRLLLQNAVMRSENILVLSMRHLDFWEGQGVHNFVLSVSVGTWQYYHGIALSQLYECTGKEKHLKKAAEVLTSAAKYLQRNNLPGWVAECHWRRAQIHDAMGEYAKAAECFALASDNYSRARKKIPQFRDFYKNLSVYLGAWNEVENAKHHHLRQECDLARQDFERASDEFKSLKQWNHLAPNFSAWAQVEQAEDLSKKEQSEEAVKVFKHAATLFEETMKSIKASLSKDENEQINELARSLIETSEQEKEMTTGLLKATRARVDYCLARISIEEARILDQKGDHYSSSEKYASAAETFEKAAQSLNSKEDLRECNFFVAVSRAWQRMMLAEANLSPRLFGEASQFFEQASHLCSSEKIRLSILGHSHFCKALEAGTMFADARETATHSEAMHQLQSATDYYRRAGLESAAQYARATGLLFDSYAYMDRAKRDIEPEKKTELYKMVEMLLKTSAGCYMKAKRPEKMEQVLKLLEGVKEERELAMSLTEILKGSPVVSTTTLSAPMPTHEKPVGLERLEHAVVQTRLKASPDVTVGEIFEIRLDVVNVARNLGSLVRIEDLVPQGFKITEAPSECKPENGSLNLNGRRLEPLKIETIKILMQATQEGTFSVCPKVVYTDDAGKTHASGSEPVQITVRPPLSFEFKTEATHKVFNYLIQAFVEDYMRRKLHIQEAGWRSLVQVVRGTGTSLRSVYGESGRRGLVVVELERRGLIDTRIFQGRRGRGGAVLKVRIPYEKETVRRYVDDRVAKGDKNREAPFEH